MGTKLRHKAVRLQKKRGMSEKKEGCEIVKKKRTCLDKRCEKTVWDHMTVSHSQRPTGPNSYDPLTHNCLVEHHRFLNQVWACGGAEEPPGGAARCAAKGPKTNISCVLWPLASDASAYMLGWGCSLDLKNVNCCRILKLAWDELMVVEMRTLKVEWGPYWELRSTPFGRLDTTNNQPTQNQIADRLDR